MAVYVLDTSAILASFKGEPGHEEVRRVLTDAGARSDTTVYLPFIALMEVEYQFIRVMSEREVDYWTNLAMSWPVRLVESTAEWRRMAALVKSPGKLSLADAWVASLALLNDAELVHKDPEFDTVSGLKALRLPYDREAAGGGRA
jgi:predicted nucleic acid-binding protein